MFSGPIEGHLFSINKSFVFLYISISIIGKVPLSDSDPDFMVNVVSATRT